MENEKRLIDANALLSAIDEYMKNVYGCPLNEVAEFQAASSDTKVVYMVEGLYEATEIIDEAPTVDAVEMVHGRWLSEMHSNSNNGTCSVCGSYEHAYAFEWKYCPFCGAKMDK